MKNYWKSIAAAVLALVMILSLAACGSKDSSIQAPTKVEGNGGSAAYSYDLDAKSMTVTVTDKVQSKDGNGFDPTYGLVNLGGFSDVKTRNNYLITLDSFIYNPLFTSGKIKTIVFQFPNRAGAKDQTYKIKASGGKVTKVYFGTESYEYSYDGGKLEEISMTTADYKNPYRIVKFHYDGDRIVSYADQASAGYSNVETTNFSVSYDSQGRIASIRSSESTTSYSYDGNGRLSAIASSGKFDQKTVSKFTYDGNGNIARIVGRSTSMKGNSTSSVVFSGYQTIG